MILVAMELLHTEGQQLQMAQAAEPKQQAAVLPKPLNRGVKKTVKNSIMVFFFTLGTD